MLRLGHAALRGRSPWWTSCARAAASIDLTRLSDALGVPVVGVVGHRGLGLGELPPPAPASRALEPAAAASRPAEPRERDAWLASVLARVLVERPGPSRTTEAIDRVVLHPVAGTLLFAGVMVLFFQLIFAWATPAMDAIDAGVATFGETLRAALPPGLFADFLVDGMVAGVGSVIVFLPQILLLFTLLYLLEDLGYMARAAFVVDRLMGRIGLEGRAFVALLSSYACAVPGIMATRTIPSPRQRLVTILVSPLMTCSARLPVYALLIGAFVPPVTVAGFLGLQGLVLLGLYVLGANRRARRRLAALDGPRARRRAARSTSSCRRIACRRRGSLLSQVWGAARAFLRRAGTIILAGLDRALGPAPRSRASRPAPGPAGARLALEASAAGQHRARARARDRAARLRLEDRRRARREPGRARGDRGDPGSDLRGLRSPTARSLREAIRERRRPAHRSPGLHTRDGRVAARVLRVRAPVHVDARDHAARDELLALAGVRLRLPSRACLGSELRDPSDRECAHDVAGSA